MESNSFARIITLLRKEKGLSQKKAAEDLGISQALLSHYEKGVRECGLNFVIKVAKYYDVTSDYLLGLSPQRENESISLSELPDASTFNNEKFIRGSLLPTLNKKLLFNSINIIFSILQETDSKSLTTEVSACILLSVYKAFRIVYSSNPKNPQGMFSFDEDLHAALSSAAHLLAESQAICLSKGKNIGDLKGIEKDKLPALSPEIISQKYPLYASSLYNLISTAENRIKNGI